MEESIKEWFSNASNITVVHKIDGQEFIIYKGFKISKFNNGGFEILDTRFSDIYSEVSKKDLDVLRMYGFVKGVSMLRLKRDKKRVKHYTRKLEKLYTEIEKYKKELGSGNKSYGKKIKNCEDNIQVNLDLMFFYSSRIEQFNNLFKDEIEN